MRVRDFADVDENPTERLNKIEARLDAISKLKRKYGATVEEVLAFRDDIAARLDALENMDQLREELGNEMSKLKKD